MAVADEDPRSVAGKIGQRRILVECRAKSGLFSRRPRSRSTRPWPARPRSDSGFRIRDERFGIRDQRLAISPTALECPREDTSMSRSLLNAAAILALTAVVHAADWPQFQGPARTRVSTETGLSKQ